tara:strand:- start:46 stop:759 length:714 start_codon:yes stop_codon:yes gene_type:complete
MSVKIHGKEYRTVAERVNLFHEEHKDAVKSVKTKILHNDERIVVMRTTIKIGDCVYHGHAGEVYGSSNINKTSALENCETSAIGRALASAGFGGTEFASADEMANAISQQNKLEKSPAAHNGSSTNGHIEKNDPYIHTDEIRNSFPMFGKHGANGSEPKLWKDVPMDYLDWLSNDSDNDKWKMIAMGEITARASESVSNGANKNGAIDKDEDRDIQESMQLNVEPSIEQGEDDDLPF